MPRFNSPRTAYKKVPAGAHVAWLAHYIDLGTHEKPSERYGNKMVRHGKWNFVIPGELMDDGRPMSIGKNLTLSGHENGNFRKLCSSWLGRGFTDASFDAFDERELFQVPCLITVVEGTDRDGGVMVYVDSIIPIPKNMPVGDPPADFIYISLDPERFDPAEMDKLDTLMHATPASKIKAMITSSPEWAALAGDEQLPEGSAGDQQWHTEDPAPAEGEPVTEAYYEDENPAPPPAPAPRQMAPQRPAQPQQQAYAPARPAAAPAAPARPAAAPVRPMAAAPAQRPGPAPAARPMAAAPQPAARPMAPQRPAGPAPARPAPAAGAISQRAAAPQRQTMAPAAAYKDADLKDEIPF